MAYEAHYEWVDQIVSANVSDASKELELESKKRGFLDGDIDALKDFPGAESLAGINFADELKSIGEEGRDVFEGTSFVQEDGTKIELISSKGDRISRLGTITLAREEELDIGDDSLGEMKTLEIRKTGKNGKSTIVKVDMKTSADAKEIMDRLSKTTLRAQALSEKMAAAGFSPETIEKEVWTPLVRQRAIPADQVPSAYSSYVQMMDGAAALYEEVLERADGTLGEENGWDKLLSAAKHGTDFAKLVGGEAMRHGFSSILEGTRNDLGEWINFKETPEGWQSCKETWESLSDKTYGNLKAALFTEAKLELIAAGDFPPEIQTEEDLDAWAEAARAEEDPSDATVELLAKYDDAETDAQGNADMTQLTHQYGESAQAQAIMASASAGVDMILHGAEASRKRKKDKIEIVETFLTDAVCAGFMGAIASNDGQDRVSDTDTQNQLHDLKYAMAGSKALVKAAGAVARAVDSGMGRDWKSVEAAVTSALSEVIKIAASTASAVVGQKEAVRDSDGNQVVDDDGMLKSKDTRADGALIELSANISAEAARAFYHAARTKDMKAALATLSIGAVTAGGVIWVDKFGEIRDNVEGDEGTSHLWKESKHSDGQTGFNMSSALDTRAGQADYRDDQADALGEMQDMRAEQKARAEKLDRLRTDGFSGRLTDSEDQKELEELQEKYDSLRENLALDDNQRMEEMRKTFDAIRDKIFSDPNAREAAANRLQEEKAELRGMMAETDLSKIQDLPKEAQAAAQQKALRQIEELTLQMKQDEMKIKMITGGTKFVIGAVAKAVPGASLGPKIFDLVMDVKMLKTRIEELTKWRANLEATFDNYSPLAPVAAGEHDLKRQQVLKETATVTADILGVSAEAARVADLTNASAAVLTTVEKGIKFVSSKWYAHWTKKKIVDGWKAYKLAREFPENRRKALEAMRLNSTLAKCIIAHGAVNGDAEASRIARSCGLTASVLENDNDICHSLVSYLETKLGKDTAVYGSYGGSDWFPSEPQIDYRVWMVFKSTARTLKPPLDDAWFKRNDIDEAIKAVMAKRKVLKKASAGCIKFVQKDPTPADADIDENFDAVKDVAEELKKSLVDLRAVLAKAKPTANHDGKKGPHSEMVLAIKSFDGAARLELAGIEIDIEEVQVEINAVVRAAQADDDEDDSSASQDDVDDDAQSANSSESEDDPDDDVVGQQNEDDGTASTDDDDDDE